jgi:hypothetical protein
VKNDESSVIVSRMFVSWTCAVIAVTTGPLSIEYTIDGVICCCASVNSARDAAYSASSRLPWAMNPPQRR